MGASFCCLTHSLWVNLWMRLGNRWNNRETISEATSATAPSFPTSEPSLLQEVGPYSLICHAVWANEKDQSVIIFPSSLQNTAADLFS